VFFVQQLACIFSIIACIVGNDELQVASNLLNCLRDGVCACMQTQHKVEIDKRDGKFGPIERVMQAVTSTDLIDQFSLGKFA